MSREAEQEINQNMSATHTRYEYDKGEMTLLYPYPGIGH